MRDLSEPSMEEWLVAQPDILGGKPCIRGTRISVEHVLELLASGATREEILRAYPQVSEAGLNSTMRELGNNEA